MAVTRHLTTCPLDCFDCCSLVVSVDDTGKVMNIEGNKEHPITRGFICEKGRKHMERVHHPFRLKYPMRKVNGQWERLSWEAAINLITEKIKLSIKEYGNKAIGLYSYGGAAGLLKNIEDLFFDYMGGTTQVSGSICWGAGNAAQKLDFGMPLGHDIEDMENSKSILIWGRNPVHTNIHLVPFLKAAKERGASLILIDPLKTATAGLCDSYIRVRPEGDAALACAVAKLVIERNLYDKAFADNHTVGFRELCAYLDRLDMQDLLELGGVSKEDVEMLTGKLTVGKPATVYMGYGIQRCPYGGTAVRCIDMLMAITGNVGIPGGGANYSNSAANGCLEMNPFHVKKDEHRYINRASFGRAVKSLTDPPLKVLFISRGNPVVQLPNTNEVISAMEHIEFKICLEHFLTDTAQLADLVLPVTYFLEEEDMAVPGMWSHYAGKIGRCVDRYYEARPEYEIYTELAERLGYADFPRLTAGQWLELITKPIMQMGLKLEELKEKGYSRNPASVTVPWQDMRFETASGKFELVTPTELERYYEHMCHKSTERFRLIFVHSPRSLHSQHMLEEAENKLPTVYFHKEAAAAEGLEAGGRIKVYNNYGSIEAIAGISSSCAGNILYMEQGWWIRNGGGVNKLTPDGVSDIGSQGIMNHCFCDIKRIREN